MPKHPTPAERDERVAIPLDAEDALRGLLAVKDDEPEPQTTPRTKTTQAK